MGSSETRVLRGRRRGSGLTRKLVSELIETRRTVGLSQQALADLLGRSQADISRFERLRDTNRVSVVELCEVASVLGLELGAGLHPVGDPLRDKGHQALIARFRAHLAPDFRIAAEVLFSDPGDRRAWDLVLRMPRQVIGVEAETRIRDVQWLVRRMHERQQYGGAHVIVLVLADTRVNRALVDELRMALGREWSTSPRAILRALRQGQPVPGSGVVLV